MIRHTQAAAEAMSLFSFLSVITCTIGPLMLVLVCTSVLSFWGADVQLELPSVKGGDANRKRIFVECRKDGLAVLTDEYEAVVTVQDLEDPQRWLRGPYGRCLSALVNGRGGGALHFVIRRDGMAVYRKAYEYALAVGGGTSDQVAARCAAFSIGRQLVLRPGALRLAEVRETRS